VQMGANSLGTIVGGGLEQLCLEGNSLAGYGLQMLSGTAGRYRQVYIHNTTAYGGLQNVASVDLFGNSENRFEDVRVQQDSATSGKGWGAGAGTVNNNTHHDVWDKAFISYRNAVGFECQSIDSLYFDGRVTPNSGGTAKGLQLLGHPSSALQACRSNRFIGAFGSNAAGTAPTAESDTNPSVNNYIHQNTESGQLFPVINGTATLTWETNNGAYFSNAVGANWTTYTPALTCPTGTLTAASAAGRYKLAGKVVHLSILTTITTNGSCAGSVRATLPSGILPSADSRYVLAGLNATTGAVIYGQPLSAGYATIKRYDNAYPGADATTLTVSGTYERN
jgi:hypothetical protein